MEHSTRHAAQSNNQNHTNILLRFSFWIKEKDLAFWVISFGMIVMLLWAGSFKLTAPAAEGIAPLLTNSPFISWQVKLWGIYHTSDFIGITEYIVAVLMIIGYFKPQSGIIGSTIAVLMFFVTTTMLITTPGTLIKVNGIRFMNNLGLFLYIDIINLGASLFLVSQFGHRAALRTK